VKNQVDAIVVGAGPNGLAAAITLARAGRSVRVYEAAATAGGGVRTADLTLPGFRHDLCSTILPLSIASPFFRAVDLASHRRGPSAVHETGPSSAQSTVKTPLP
jgi:phytoene dehydrogenase-like protein